MKKALGTGILRISGIVGERDRQEKAKNEKECISYCKKDTVMRRRIIIMNESDE